MAKILDGKVFAKDLRDELKGIVSTLREEYGNVPGLAVVLVGDNPASEVYVRNKGIQTKECGMRSYEYKLASTVQQDDLLKVIISKTLSDNQINISPKISDFIINNVDRSYEKMFKFLKDVDELSLSTGKSININLIKKVLNR